MIQYFDRTSSIPHMIISKLAAPSPKSPVQPTSSISALSEHVTLSFAAALILGLPNFNSVPLTCSAKGLRLIFLFCAIIANLFLMIEFAPHKDRYIFLWNGWKRGLWSWLVVWGRRSTERTGRTGMAPRACRREVKHLALSLIV